MKPGIRLAHDLDDLREGIERSGVHLAGLRADDRRAAELGERRAQPFRLHSTLVVGVYDDELRGADAQQPQRAVDGHMAESPDDDADRRRLCEAALADVPASLGENLVPCGGECSHVRHLTAGGDRERGARREAEQVLEPLADDHLESGDRWPEWPEAGALVPDRRQPIGRDRGGKSAAGHVSEVATARGRDHSRLDGACKLLDHAERIGGRLRKRPVEGAGDLLHRSPWEHGALAERVEIVGRELRGSAKEVALVAHAARSFSNRAGSSNGPTRAR